MPNNVLLCTYMKRVENIKTLMKHKHFFYKPFILESCTITLILSFFFVEKLYYLGLMIYYTTNGFIQSNIDLKLIVDYHK